MSSRAKRLTVVSLVIVVAAVSVAFWYSRREADTGAAVTHCGPTDTLGEKLGTSDVRLSPFSTDSPWKQSVAGQPTPSDAGSPKTLALRATEQPGIDGGAPYPIHTWLNAEQFSIPVVQADPCDPLVSFVAADSTPSTTPSDTFRVPADAQPASGTDRHLLVIQPDGHTLVEMWQAERVSDTSWNVGRVEVVDLRGDGIGPDNGVRAYGGSALGGLIRTWEIDPSDPNYTDGVIRHPLAVAVPGTMLRYDTGDPGYDANGYGTALGYVSPATEQDFDSPWSYTGVIPMGSRVVLPAAVDIDTLDLGPEARAIAQALQDYGAYVIDRTAPDTVSFYAEPSAPPAWLTAVRGPNDGGGQLDRIREQLVVVDPG